APAGPAGQAARRAAPHLALAVEPGVRSPTAAEALPATIVVLDKRSRRLSYPTLVAVVMVAVALGGLLVLWLR
ncbi:MAG: hypothetical protein ACRDOU_16365, partial [Streptosporangiaceae bacterium]